MSKIILFSNIKGGVGKTTLCALFAEFLSSKGLSVVVADADLQASLIRHRERELEEEPQLLLSWDIFLLDTLDPEQLKTDMDMLRRKDGIVIVDTPGNLSDNNLVIIYSMADLIVIPMTYDIDTIDATGIYIDAIQRNTSVPLIFVPNRINSNEGKAYERELWNETNEILGQFGTVTPRIKQSVSIKRYSTIHPLNRLQYAAVEKAFEMITQIVKN